MKLGVKQGEFDAYQELHQAVFDGVSINMDDHESSAYLETSESNVPAQRLFASVGFTHLSSWQWYAKTVEPF